MSRDVVTRAGEGAERRLAGSMESLSANNILQHLEHLGTTYPWIAVSHHILICLALSFLVFWKKSASRILTAEGVLLLGTVSLTAYLAGNAFTGTIFGTLALFWLSELALNKMSFDPMQTSLFRRLTVAGVLLWALWYPHFIPRPFTTGWWRGPVGVVPCPTLMLALGYCVAAHPNSNSVLHWLTVICGVFYGLVGFVMLRVWADLPLLLIIVYAIILPVAFKVNQRRETSNSKDASPDTESLSKTLGQAKQ